MPVIDFKYLNCLIVFFTYLFLFTGLTFTFKAIFRKWSSTTQTRYLLLFMAMVLLCLSGTAIVSWFEAYDLPQLDINKSIFSILLSSQIAFVVPLLLCQGFQNKSVVVQFFIFQLLAIAVFALFFTNGRAGWIGLLVASAYIMYQRIRNCRLKRLIRYSILPVTGLVVSFLFWHKPQSSNGRILIYKISAEILKDNWLWGIGPGQFKVKYNEYQAAYFATHDIDNSEALLADNTYYAFNDYWQFIIETGLVGMLFLIVLLIAICKQLSKIKQTGDDKSLSIAAISSLICIATGALFSYPLQTFPIMVQAILCLAIIGSMSSRKSTMLLAGKTAWTRKTILLLIGLLLIAHACCYIDFQIKKERATAFQRADLTQQSLAVYKELSSSYIKDGTVLYRYAKQLYLTNQLETASAIIREAKKYACFYELYQLSASIENDLQHFDQAEKDYLTAMYMVPNRMMSRQHLLNFYLERKDTAHATYWANSILHMPVKIPSEITAALLERTNNILLGLNKK